MRVLVQTPPPPLLSAAEVRRHCRIADGEPGEDAYLDMLIAAATGHLDGPGGWLGRALGEQVLDWHFDPRARWERLELPYGPAREVIGLAVMAPDDLPVSSASWFLDAAGLLRRVPSAPWPSASDATSLRVRYRAGWPVEDGAWTGPQPIRHALLMLVARLHAQRGEDVAASLAEDRSIAALLAPWRVWSL